MLVRSPVEKPHHRMHYGTWVPERAYLSQYHWKDTTPLLNTSTAELRALKATQRQAIHKAHTKWELALARPIPEHIWSSIWLLYRGAAKNTFLWQLLYRVIATQQWRFPQKPATDPCTWCTRCEIGVREDLIHCIWSCVISVQSWNWGSSLLKASSPNHTAQIQLSPAHIFMAAPLTDSLLVPDKLWQILKAILYWQIWKNRNAHYMAGKPANTQKIIRKSWHLLT